MSGIQAHMKIALVTGANKGIGREVARQLAAKGFHVFIGARNRSAGRKAADEIAKKGGEATFLEIDVSDNNSVAAAARELPKPQIISTCWSTMLGSSSMGMMRFWRSTMNYYE